MKKVPFILTAAIANCLSSTLYAQSGSAELPSIAPFEVQITNTSSTNTVYFRVSGNKCSPPLDVSLKPDYYGTYTCDRATEFSFSITTRMRNGTSVPRTATLQPTKRYEIYSDSAGVWSIREVHSH